MSRHNKHKGFSLIELVAVVIIMGVLATASTQYIIFGTQIYIQANDRQAVLSESRFIVERITRELRNALPNSIRTSTATNNTQACIEFLPIKASGAYRVDTAAITPPIKPYAAGNQLEVISWGSGQYDTNDRLYIYALTEDHVYLDTDRFAIIDSVTLNPSEPEYLITFDANVTYADASTINRYYTADHSVSYCLIANGAVFDVYRFEDTSFSAAQTLPTVSSGTLMAEGLTNTLSSEPPFEYIDGVMVRNSVVNLYLEFNANQDENMFFNHEVHIPNVP